MSDKIKCRRGDIGDIPTLDEGELGLADDAGSLYIGSTSGNILLNPVKLGVDGYQIDGYLVPTTDNVHGLGTITKRWSNLVVGPGSIHLVSSAIDPAGAKTWTMAIDINGDLAIVNENGSLALGIDESTSALMTTNGSESAPVYSFLSDQDTGIYGNGSNELNIVTGGSDRVNVSSTGILVDNSGVIRVPNGSSSDPSYTFSSDTDTGMLLVGDGIIGFVTAGSEAFRVDSSGVVGFSDGTESAPSISFASDTNTGIYRSGSDNLKISTGGATRLAISNHIVAENGSVFKSTDGYAAQPAYGFDNDTDTGLFSVSSNILGFSIGGTERWRINESGHLSAVSNYLLRAGDGYESLPSYSFTSDTNTGLYINGPDNLKISTGGATRLAISNHIVAENGSVFKSTDGYAAQPGYTFNSDPDTGMYLVSSGTIGISSSGNLGWTVTDSVLGSYGSGVIRSGDGTDVSPGYSFASDTNTGLYINGPDNLKISTGGAARLAVSNHIVAENGSVFKTTDGYVGQPGYTFDSEPNSGLYLSGAKTISTSIDGSQVIETSSGTSTFSQEDLILTSNSATEISSINTNSAGASFLAGSYTTGAYSSSGDVLGEYKFAGSTLIGQSTAAYISAVASQNWGLLARGSELRFSTITSDTSSITEKVRIINSGQIRGQYGSASEPAYSFLSDADTGVYGSSGVLSFSAAGTERIRVNSSGLLCQNSSRIYAGDGTAALPGITFVDDTNSGMYRVSSDTIGFSTGGEDHWNITSTGNFVSQSDPGQVILSGLGYAGGPSYSFGSDTDTGMYRVTTNTIGFATGAAEAMRIDSNSSVIVGTTGATGTGGAKALGVGTSSPVSGIHLKGSAGSPGSFIRVDSTGINNSGISFAEDGVVSANVYWDASDAALILESDGGIAVSVDASGVGIGTNSPATTLHISSETPAITITDTTDNTEAKIYTSVNGGLYFDADTNNEKVGTKIFFQVDTSTKVVIDSDGKMGIGDPTPDAMLDIYSTSESDFFIMERNSTDAVGPRMYFRKNRGDADTQSGDVIGAILGYASSGGGLYRACAIEFSMGANATGTSDPQPGQIEFSTNNYTRMTIDKDGRVGVNQSPDSSSQFAVNGDIEAFSGDVIAPTSSDFSLASAESYNIYVSPHNAVHNDSSGVWDEANSGFRWQAGTGSDPIRAPIGGLTVGHVISQIQIYWYKYTTHNCAFTIYRNTWNSGGETTVGTVTDTTGTTGYRTTTIASINHTVLTGYSYHLEVDSAHAAAASTGILVGIKIDMSGSNLDLNKTS